MEKDNFKLVLSTERPPKEVFQTILKVRDWWSGYHNEQFTGETEKLNDVFHFYAAGGLHQCTQKIVGLIPNQRIVWLVTDSTLGFVEKSDEWNNSKIIFDISKKENKTQLTFTHEGLTPEIECYNSCAPSWTRYLQNKLMPLISQTKL